MLAVFVAEVCRKLRPARRRKDAIIGSPCRTKASADRHKKEANKI